MHGAAAPLVVGGGQQFPFGFVQAPASPGRAAGQKAREGMYEVLFESESDGRFVLKVEAQGRQWSTCTCSNIDDENRCVAQRVGGFCVIIGLGPVNAGFSCLALKITDVLARVVSRAAMAGGALVGGSIEGFGKSARDPAGQPQLVGRSPGCDDAKQEAVLFGCKSQTKLA